MTGEQSAKAKNTGWGCLILLALAALVAMCSGDDAPAAPAAPGSASAQTRGAVQGFATAVSGALALCDASAKRLGEAAAAIGADRGSALDGYEAAIATDAACGASLLKVNELAVPDLPSAAAARAKEAKQECGQVAWNKKESAQAAAEVFDGDTRPSKVTAVTSNAEAANRAQLACVATLMQVASDAGMDPTKLKIG